MKNYLTPLLNIFILVGISFFLDSCGGSNDAQGEIEDGKLPQEILGKYYDESGGGIVELKSDNTFIWIDDNNGEVLASGDFNVNEKKVNYLDYDAYYSITTNATSGSVKNEWKFTDGLRDWEGYYQLRQNISGSFFVFKKKK